jgi:RNA polymerase sigma-70 factor (ECF subfamily)
MSHSDHTDTERLVLLARAGEGAALGQLLERCRGYLTLLARVQVSRRLQGKFDPTDLVQDAFLEAHRTFSLFRGTTEAELTAWLRQILVSHVAMAVRRFCGTQRRDVRLERELADDLDRSSRALQQGLADKQSSPSQRAARREQAVLLAEALERLPEDYREVLLLRHLEGLPFPEVARRMERTVPSVKNLWTRALSLLRRSFGEVA